jgi:radical SAM superfamily enzyme YgiQ (UPF0313 family)
MKTLLVNPDAQVYRHIPPLALAYVATALKIPVIDQNTKPNPPDRFLEKMIDHLALFVRSVTFGESKRIAKIYKEKYPGCKISSIFTPIDVQCCYPTIQFNNSLKFTKPFGDSYPFPDFSLFDSFEVFLRNWQSGQWPYGILTSVGCPFQCIYCAARNRGWHPRSAENCIEELKRAKKNYQICSFEILDDAFNIDKKRVIGFSKAVKPLGLRWICANGLRADLFDEDQAKAMSASGCDSVSFGIESVEPEVLSKIKKGETIEQINKAVEIAKKYFKRVNGFFIIGLPTSSYKKDLGSIQWMIKKQITGVFSYYVPFDKQAEYDDMFYGIRAKPQSEEYPKKEQQDIYQMVDLMRQSASWRNLFPKIFNLLYLIYRFDKENFLTTSLAYFKRVVK